MTRIDSQRSHYRVKRFSKVVFEKLFLLAAYFVQAKQMNAFGCNLRQNAFRGKRDVALPRVDGFFGKWCSRPTPRRHRRGFCRGVIDMLLQMGHPNHEEFIKIATKDGEELYALKKWNRGSFGFLQNTTIEFKP